MKPHDQLMIWLFKYSWNTASVFRLIAFHIYNKTHRVLVNSEFNSVALRILVCLQYDSVNSLSSFFSEIIVLIYIYIYIYTRTRTHTHTHTHTHTYTHTHTHIYIYIYIYVYIYIYIYTYIYIYIYIQWS